MAKQTLNTLRNWFKTGLKPLQQQFWDWMDSYWHKDEKIPIANVDELEKILNDLANSDTINSLTIQTLISTSNTESLATISHVTAGYVIVKNVGVFKAVQNLVEDGISVFTSANDGWVWSLILKVEKGIFERPDYESLPLVGEKQNIYITTNNSIIYRWNGNAYTSLNPIAISDTDTINLTGDGRLIPLSANIKISSAANNLLSVNTDGLFSGEPVTTDFGVIKPTIVENSNTVYHFHIVDKNSIYLPAAGQPGSLRFYINIPNTWDLIWNGCINIHDLRYGKVGAIYFSVYDLVSSLMTFTKTWTGALRIRCGVDSANGNKFFIHIGNEDSAWGAVDNWGESGNF